MTARATKWETDPDYDDFKKFLKSVSVNIEKIRKQRRGKSNKRAPKNSKQPGQYTLEWMDTDPHRVDVKYYQGLIAGRKNFTMLTLYKICRKLEIQPQELFKQIGIDVAKS